MNKRALMLSAATVALLTVPAEAAGPTTISTIETTAQKTSATGDLTINSGGGINLKSATVPLLTIDSSNTVNNGGALTAQGQTTATAVQIQAGGFTGSFTSNGSIDLTGAGTGKMAIDLTGTSFFNGGITLDTNSVVHVTGDQSTGILTDSTTVLRGDLSLAGTFTMAPSTANETSSSQVTIANLLGTIKGNVVIAASSSYTATGNAAQGIVISGPLQACDPTVVAGCTEIGTFANSGNLAVAGIATRSATATNAESGSALVIGNSIAGGILNNGPSSSSDTTAAATISGNGSSATAPAILISPDAGVPITIGIDTADTANGTFSFINRGVISSAPEDPNFNTNTIVIVGGTATPITFTGGFFNSGLISATSTNISPGIATTATALQIGDFVTIPQIYVSAQSASSTGTNGSILAQVSGPEGGTAAAVLISGTTNTSVPSITVEAGARISAAATVTDPTNAAVTVLSAVGIRDTSNSLATINNAGTISAQVTTLTNGHTAIAHAVDVSLNSTALNFTNTGVVVGDVLFGTGADTYTVMGSSPAAIATHTGAINFGFSNGGSGADTLHVAQFANVAGTITAQGTLDVTVDQTGTLTVQNVGETLATRDFNVAGGTTSSAGTLNITVSGSATSSAVVTASDKVVFGSGANLNVQYGSFVTSSGTFGLISAPTGKLGISATDIARYNAAVGSSTNLPFLFNSASVTTINDGAGHDVLQLTVSTKSVDQLALTGYARAIFPYANVAVANDTALGAALILGINSKSDAQAAYDAFVPDVSGGVRAVAISLTDQATGVVAARQRELRMFGKQQGDLTLWGNEFGEFISTHGGNVPVTTGAGAAINFGPASGFKDHGFGFSMGVDEGGADSGWYGAAFTFYTGDVGENGDRTSKTNTLWYLLTGYSDWRGRGLFVDTQATVGYGDFKGKRTINLTLPASNSTFTREADSKRAGLVAALGMTMGGMLKYGSTTVIPQISLDGLTMREEGFTETNGGSGFNLTVKPYYANSLRAFLGTEIREDINFGDFFIQPSARVGYRFDFLADPVRLRAAFADVNSTLGGNQPGSEFVIQGPDPSRGNVVAGANLNATTDNWTIGLNYDFVRGSNSATEQVGTISLLGRI